MAFQISENYLNLVAEQLKIYFENREVEADESTLPINTHYDELKRQLKIKDDLLVEQLELIKSLIVRLFTIDKGLRLLEQRTLSVSTCIASREQNCLQNKIEQLEAENKSLKDALMIDKTHIEKLDGQFKEFLEERDELKRRYKALEKKIKGASKEKDNLQCYCEVLKKEIQELQDREMKFQEKINDVSEEKRQTLEQITSLNEENRYLSQTIDVLRQKNEFTSSLTQEEVGKLNTTIEELKDSLEETRLARDNDEKVHENEILSLNVTISNLERSLKAFQEKYEKDCKICKICKGKSKVGFLESSEVQADLGGRDSHLVESLKMKECEIQSLKGKVCQLETCLNTCEERAANLQEAVTLSTNSIIELEKSEEEAKTLLQQQKVTIANLQQALVQAKQEADELRRKNQENNVQMRATVASLQEALEQSEEENELIKKQVEMLHREHEALQDVTFALEVEHCDSLQDVDLLEGQLNNYKSLFKTQEEHLKKLTKQKKCYEEVIIYFKQEMALMADQLNNLQELLTLSNDTAQQESNKIMNAFMEVQSINQKLSSQLCACEQQVQLENQMNQLQEAKICELQQLVDEKEMDLSKHDQAILNIRETLNEALKQNDHMQVTILELNQTVANLQQAVRQYEFDNCVSEKSCEQFKEQIGEYCCKLDELKTSLDEKTAECLKLEMSYNNEKRALKAAQKQLQETERLQQAHQVDLVNTLEQVRQKLCASDQNNTKLCQECENLQSQLANLSRKEAVKDLEIKRYRKIVGDLKSTMLELNNELNKNLAQKELKSTCKNAECRKSADKDDIKNREICLNCPCEVEFYQRMVDILKKSVTELKRKLNDTQQKNKNLEEEVKDKDGRLAELNQKLLESQAKDRKIAQLETEIDRFTQELQVKSLQLTDVRRSAEEINGSKCMRLACAQEEIASLKSEITNLLNRQYLLKQENEGLLAQTAQLHCTVSCLNEKNKILKDQIDQYLIKIKNLNTEKDNLCRKNKELLAELRSIQTSTCSADKQHRLTADSLKQLEADIEDLKLSKDEICSESRNVIRNVRSWVIEQKKINSLVAKRERDLVDTIKQLNDVNSREPPPCQSQRPAPIRPCRLNRGSAYNLSTSPCSLGSQGTGSYGPSPPLSPDFGLQNEWYSSTFRQTDTENDSEEEYCVNTLENLTQQMKRSNCIWMDEKRSRSDCRANKQAQLKK